MLDLSGITVEPVGPDWEREYPGYFYAQMREDAYLTVFRLAPNAEEALTRLLTALGFGPDAHPDGHSVRVVGTVKLGPPKWSDLLRVYRAVLEDGAPEGRDLVWAELARMAEAADRYNEMVPPGLDAED